MTLNLAEADFSLWRVSLWRHKGGHTELVQPYEYLVAVPKDTTQGHIVAMDAIIHGGMLPDHAYDNEFGEEHRLSKGYVVDADIVEWERPGNIARLF